MNPLEGKLGYSFRNPELLANAFVHSSRINTANNQRMEFLGDAVLGMIVAEMLYAMFPHEKEGELARRHAALVCGEMLARIAKENNLGDFLQLAASEEALGGRTNPSNLEDACEALIGALYLDGGLEAAKQFVLPRWEALASQVITPPKDPKTALQEWAQARGKPVPAYTLLESTGPSHAPLFTIQVSVQGEQPLQAQAKSKRLAEQAAAKALLESLQST